MGAGHFSGIQQKLNKTHYNTYIFIQVSTCTFSFVITTLNSMEVVEVETNRGKRSIICDWFWYRVDGILKSYVVSWRCFVKDCKGRIRTDRSVQTVLMQKNKHSHEPDERKNERHQLRATAKRKATDDITQRPSKIIRR